MNEYEDSSRPGHVLGPPDMGDPSRFSPAPEQISMLDLAYQRIGSPDMSRLRPDPVRTTMDSADHLQSAQFGPVGVLGVVHHTRDELPAVHANPLGWYGTQRVIRHPDVTGLEAQDGQ